MKNLFLIAVFAMVSSLSFAQETANVWVDDKGNKTEIKGDFIFVDENGDTTKPKRKEVRVEKEIENGKEKTRVWVDGKEVKEGSAEYKKYANGEIKTDGKVKVEKRKGKKGEDDKVIIIKKEMEEDVIINGEEMEIDVDVKEDGDNHKIIIKKKGKDGKEEIEEIIIKGGDSNAEVIELDGDKKMMFIKVEEDIEIEGSGDVDVNVTSGKDGKQKVIIKKKTKDGKEEIKEMIIDDNGEETIIDGDTKVIIKTKKDSDLDLEGIDPDDIETIDIKKTDTGKTVTIKTKDGKTIVKKMKNDTESEGTEKVIIRTQKEDNFDFDLDGLDPETIETIDIKKTDDGKTITIKTKDGKTIMKKISGNDEDVKVIKKQKIKKDKE